MKKIYFTLIAMIVFTASYAQILNPVRFNYSVIKKGKNLYEVHVKTFLDPKWHIYSIKNPEGGAEATKIKVNEGTAVGAAKEIGKLQVMYDKEFKADQKFYESTVDFVQVVKLKSGGDKITGTVTYMVCNDKQCLPPKDVEFKIKL